MRSRIRAFAKSFAEEIAPQLTHEQVDDITTRVFAREVGEPQVVAVAALPPPPALDRNGPLSLEFRHDCL